MTIPDAFTMITHFAWGFALPLILWIPLTAYRYVSRAFSDSSANFADD